MTVLTSQWQRDREIKKARRLRERDRNDKVDQSIPRVD